MTSTYDLLNARLQAAFDSVAPGADPVLRTSERSDYQANGVMALATRVSRPPRDVANEVVAACDLAGVASVEVAGPGFLNITLSVEFLNNQLRALLGDARVGRSPARTPKTVVINYSAPNVAKELHV